MFKTITQWVLLVLYVVVLVISVVSMKKEKVTNSIIALLLANMLLTLSLK